MFLALALSALTMWTPVATPQGPAATPAPREAMVCKYTIKTGTRFRDKKCRTRAEWDAITEAARQNMKDTVDRPQIRIDSTLPPQVACREYGQC